jgi:hypothetical protein
MKSEIKSESASYFTKMLRTSICVNLLKKGKRKKDILEIF